MSVRIPLTLACGDYESVRALKDGTVKPEGIDLTVLSNIDATTRNWRFLRNRELDMAEISSCSYIMARDQGMPISAIPVFLHRRFRHGFIFINTTKGIREPKDLIGKKIGCKIFLVSAIHWLRGILEHEYGVPVSSIQWFTELDEDLEFTPPPGLNITRLPDDASVETMLEEGELDALLHPDLIRALRVKDPRVARLFPDHKAEEIAYYRKTGIFPIMHVIGIKNEIVERYPWVAINMFQAFNESKKIAQRRLENPRIVPLAWYRETWEEQEEILGPDPWEHGLTPRNRHTLETYLGYFHEQGLLKTNLSLDQLFLETSQGRKRGDVYRF